MRPETLAIHAAAQGRRANDAGALRAPIHVSTTFERDPSGAHPSGWVYARLDNPNRSDLEACLARLEGGAAAAAFPSGMAAALAVFGALSPGDRVVIDSSAYYGTRALLDAHFVRWGLRVAVADLACAEATTEALNTPTALVWVESPSNPTLRIVDLARLAAQTAHAGARLVCDNTWATPILQRPLTLGADWVVHSTTKYLAGHSDVTGGAVIARDSDDLAWQRVVDLQRLGGVVPSPMDCWWVRRGLLTLPARMRAHCAGAWRVAAFLDEHPAVERVHYPGRTHHPGHAIAARQMRDFGGMLAFVLPGGSAEALAFTGRVRLIQRATSLGGPETLIEHRASIEGPDSPTPPGLLRLSVGLEHPDDLIEDLAQALAR